MNKKLSKKVEHKYVTEKTFEKSMVAIAKSFDSLEKKVDGGFKRQDKMLELILGELKTHSEEAKEFRKNISNLYSNTTKNERDIDNLKFRVEKIEMK